MNVAYWTKNPHAARGPTPVIQTNVLMESGHFAATTYPMVSAVEGLRVYAVSTIAVAIFLHAAK